MEKNASNLNKQQKNAAEAQNLPFLIIAGAGTGKTKTLTSRLSHFVAKGMRPERICAITFTNKAAGEMRERFLAIYDQRPITNNGEKNTSWIIYHQPSAISHKSLVGSPFIGTFHSLGAKILRAEARHLGRKTDFTIFDDHDSFQLIKNIAKKISPKKNRGRDDDETKKRVRELPAFFRRQISAAKNIPPFLARLKKTSNEKNKLALRAYELYEEDLARNNAFDFDDLIEKVVRLFGARPEILGKYQNMFDAILVDEYQDINPQQYEFIKLLAGEHKNLTVVGDDEQLIYGWRYADMEIFQTFEKDWPGAQIAFLEENYRSSGNIIAAAAGVSKNNLSRRPKNLWTKNPAGEMIKIFEATDEGEEAKWIAAAIATTYDQRLMTNDNKNTDGQKPPTISHKSSVVSPTIAVLYRTNAQSRALEQALILRQIPYKIFGGLKFYERKEIKDVVAALRWAANKSDSLSRERLKQLLSQRKFDDLEGGFASAKSGEPLELIEIFLKTTDYFEYLDNNFLNPEERRENIAELLGFASNFDNLQRFLEEIALVQAIDMPSAAYNKRPTTDDESSVISHQSLVHLSTIHLAKGLEFDRVFIAGCSEGLLPHIMSYDDKAQMEEERRLIYVAMTRAKKELLISFYGQPSRFLSEMPQELSELETEFARLDDNEVVRIE